MEITGRIKKIFDTKEITPSFQKREFVITTQEQYPQDVLVEVTQDNCTLLNAYKLNQLVKVFINIRGREWINPQGEAKYFTTIQVCRIENLSKENNNQQAYTPTGSDEDDLPF